MTALDTPVAETRCGKVQGISEKGLLVFKGIPYAAPPLGNFRWLPPQTPVPWEGIRQTREFGAIAIQPAMQLQTPLSSEKPERQDENCLFLNVYTPGLDNRKRPVMVWIHGGAFHIGSGSSSMFPGHTLPLKGNLVFVSLNYRLGVLGFLYSDQISDGNAGLLDQIAALQWVHDNIAAFGGDPANVTVFGESAGAMSSGCLLSMPAARGLFQKAILQSGVSTVRTLQEANTAAQKYLASLEIKKVDRNSLLALPGEYLIQKETEMSGPNTWSLSKGALIEPVVDGRILPELPLDAIAAGSAAGIPVLNGSNLDEATIFLAPIRNKLAFMTEKDLHSRLEKFLPADFSGDLISCYRAALPSRGPGEISPFRIYTAILTDLQFRIPSVRLAESQNKHQTAVFNYIFDWPSVIPGLGACHSLELGFLFGNFQAGFEGQGFAAAGLSERIQQAWIAFAHTGNPSCPGLGEWPHYGAKRQTMILGARCHIQKNPYAAELEAWQKAPNRWLG